MNLSRRRLVRLGGAVLLSGTAGCAGSSGRRTSTETATERERTFSHCTRTPPVRQVSNQEGNPAIRSSAHTPVGEWASTHWVVATPGERAALDYSTGGTDTASVREFIEGTDLSAHSVLIHQHTFTDCLDLRLERIKWQSSEQGTEGAYDFGLEYSAAGRTCEEDSAGLTVASAVRIPSDVSKIIRFTWGTTQVGADAC